MRNPWQYKLYQTKDTKIIKYIMNTMNTIIRFRNLYFHKYNLLSESQKSEQIYVYLKNFKRQNKMYFIVHFLTTEKNWEKNIEMEFTSVGFWSCGFQGMIRDYWDRSLTLSRSRRSSRPLSPRSRPRSSRSRSERAPRSIRSPPRSRRSRISCSSRRLPKLLLEEFEIKMKLIQNKNYWNLKF